MVGLLELAVILCMPLGKEDNYHFFVMVLKWSIATIVS